MRVKQLLYLFFSFLIFSLYSCESNDGDLIKGNPYITTNNKALVELFTNTYCIPCVAANTYLDNIDSLKGITSNDTNVIIVRVHSTFNTNDPFHQFCQPLNLARETYYNVIGNPKGYLMGNSLGSFNSSNWTAQMNTQMQQSNSIGIRLTNTYDSTANTGTLNIYLSQVSGSQLTDPVMHVLVVENGIMLNPPAPNGEVYFDNTMRDCLSDKDGDPFSIIPGQALTFQKNYTIKTGVNPANTYFVVFVQGKSAKTVFGVNKINVK